jgi:tRNA dimethylallyltransferase
MQPGSVVLVGPTASGKSAVAMAVARAHPSCEIVACDAMQVYRGMDIGTAKPTRADRAEVPHHCLDLVDPTERFTAREWQVAGTAAVSSIESRSGTPIVVAGTGLYLASLVDGLEFPGEWPDIRAELEREPDTAALYARLVQSDPDAAAQAEPTNRRRIVRALEVVVGSGRPFSASGPGTGAYPQTDATMIGIRWDRDALAARISVRVREMVAGGLVDEVVRLRAAGALSRTASKALGYAEVIAHLDGACSLEDAIAATVLHTRQFAVRQERWFRRDPRIRWVDVTDDPVREVAPFVLRALTQS